MTDCKAKNGTFGALDMFTSQHVDVIFGPYCSAGQLQDPLNAQQRICILSAVATICEIDVKLANKIDLNQ